MCYTVLSSTFSRKFNKSDNGKKLNLFNPIYTVRKHDVHMIRD